MGARSIGVLCGILVVFACSFVSPSPAQVASSGLTLPYKGEYGGGDAFTISAGAGRAGFFSTINARDYDPRNMSKFDALHALSNTAGRAGFFQVNNTTSAAAALGASTNGKGPAIQGDGSWAGAFNGMVYVSGPLGIGTMRPQEALTVHGGMRVDQGNQNTGVLGPGAINFGGGATGEGIASKRTAGGNQNGLDFYTKSIPRLSITSAGFVGIGTPTPTSALDVAGAIRSSGGITSTSAGFANLSVASLGSTALTVSNSGTGMAIQATGAGTTPVIGARMTGTGSAGVFSVQNPASKSSSLWVDTNGQGSGLYVSTNAANGYAAEIYTQNASNTKATLKVVAASPTAVAAEFHGVVGVTGKLVKASGSFKIDHPLDPLNKNLYHSFVESPDMKNIYDGVATLDSRGEAVVLLPDWFEALNRDFRYQLTCIGGSALVYISEEVNNNRFSIAGGREGLKVSWQVTGIRKDPYANKHRVLVEEEKSPGEKGHYLYPDAY